MLPCQFEFTNELNNMYILLLFYYKNKVVNKRAEQENDLAKIEKTTNLTLIQML